MPRPANDPEYNLTLRRGDRGCRDLGTILDELDFVKWQLSQLPTRAYLYRMLLVATASVWAILRHSHCGWRGEPVAALPHCRRLIIRVIRPAECGGWPKQSKARHSLW